MKWINIEESLPPEGKYVLIHLLKDNWIDSADQAGVYFKVAAIERGISLLDRLAMKRGDMIDGDEFMIMDGEKVTIKRSSIISDGDEDGNNEKPYCWQTFGSDKYWGQEVDYWMHIPNLPREQ